MTRSPRPAARPVTQAPSVRTVPQVRMALPTEATRALTAAVVPLLLGLLGVPATAQTLPGFSFQRYQPPVRANAPACSTVVNASARLGKLQFAQTHLLETSHPFFHLSAGRAVLVRASVTGSGPAPAVQVTARANGQALGSICLVGPGQLPATVDEAAPSLGNSFVGSLPADWVVPGLELSVTAGGATRVVTAAELKIGAAPELSFITADWLLWGDTQPNGFAGMAPELAARLPLTAIRHSPFPVALAVSQLPIPPRSDGRSPTGATVSHPALVATAKPRCSSADKTAGTCLPWSGYGVLAAVRSLTGALQRANGLAEVSHWYGALGRGSAVGGGLGGGVVASGDDYSRTFNHEFGHTFDQPHWGSALYSRVAAGSTQVHPYTGQYTDLATGQAVGGGFGNSWAVDPLDSSLFVNPVCAATGRERQEPMQRNGSACMPAGLTYDHFSDYAALSVHRYFVGAKTVQAGQVSSPRDLQGNTQPPFAFPVRSGRPNLVPGTAGLPPQVLRWVADPGAYVALNAANTPGWDFKYPAQWQVPVYTLWGSFSAATPEATTIQAPLKYVGHLPKLFDPTQPADFSAIKATISGDAFWWGADLVVRADFDNGTVRHALLNVYARGSDALSDKTFTYWAVNIPVVAGAKLTKVSLYHRPMEVRYGDGGRTGSSYHTATNLNSTLNSGVSAANYLGGATLVRTLEQPTGW